MMKYYIIILFCLFFFNGLLAQNTLEEVLRAVEKNSKTIRAAGFSAESKFFQSKADNALEGPEFAYGHFPSTKGGADVKKTIEISQSFYFPTTYYKRKKYFESEKMQANLSQIATKQQLLLDAKLLYYDIAYLNKQQSLLNKRIADTEKLCRLYQQKLEAENTTILEVNKALLHLLMYKNMLNKNTLETNNYTQQLNLMCGKKEGGFIMATYTETPTPPLDSILKKNTELSAAMLYNTNRTAVANAQVALNKSKLLPQLTAGLESEVTNTDAFRGLRIGVKLPLSGNLYETKAAKTEAQAILLETERANDELTTALKVEYQTMLLLKESYENLKSSDALLNNSALLLKSLNLGQISLIEYYREIDYFNEIRDEMLLLEKEYYKSLARLMSFEL